MKNNWKISEYIRNERDKFNRATDRTDTIKQYQFYYDLIFDRLMDDRLGETHITPIAVMLIGFVRELLDHLYDPWEAITSYPDHPLRLRLNRFIAQQITSDTESAQHVFFLAGAAAAAATTTQSCTIGNRHPWAMQTSAALGDKRR